jgi:hypothetical protein
VVEGPTGVEVATYNIENRGISILLPGHFSMTVLLGKSRNDAGGRNSKKNAC